MQHNVGFPREWIVGHVDDRYLCPICFEILRNPRQCPIGHNFCDTCLKKTMLRKRECPLCKCVLTDDNTGSNSLAKSFVEEMMSKCYVIEDDGVLHEDDACGWTGPLHLRQAHFNSCQFRRPVACLYPPGACELECCAGQFSRGGLRIHLLAVAEARACKSKVLRKELDIQKAKNIVGFSVTEQKFRGGKVDSFCGEVRKSDPTIREGFGIEKVVGNCSEGFSYVGEYVNGLRHGSGSFKSRWFSYNGMWENGLCHGECFSFLRFENNLDRHGCGTFRHNVMHGPGKIWSGSTKFSYTGEFVNDKKHGHGTWMNWTGTKSFTGQFVNDRIMGDGVLTFFNKTTLTGNFDGVDFYGFGVLKDQLGAVIYEGNFLRNKKNGRGVMRYANGDCYDGIFVKDKKCGQGTMVFADKSVYSGRFYNDKRHGEGTMTTADGVVGDIQHFYQGEVVE